MSSKAHHNKEEDFFRVLVIAKENNTISYIKVFWAWAEHIGVAIHKVIEVAQQMGLREPIATMIDFVDSESLSNDVYEICETGVFTFDEEYSFPAEDFVDIPDGVILHAEDENPEDDIKEGYKSYCNNDDFYFVDIVLSKNKLFKIFIKLVKSLPDIKVSWVSIPDENNEKAELWVNENLNDAKKILYFLKSTQADIFQNGLVGFTVYSEVGATNLNLTDHKEISVVTKSQKIKNLITAKIDQFKVKKFDELSCISEGFYHWHYRPIDSLDPKDFIAFLKSKGFAIWKQE